MKRNLSLLFSTLAFSTAVLAETTPVQVYTYDSFAADWGPGPKLKTMFEQHAPQCKVNYVTFDSAGLLFNRVRLEGSKTKADVVLGLDNYMLSDAKKTQLFDVFMFDPNSKFLNSFEPNDVSINNMQLPLNWTPNTTFLPYDFGEYAFIYDKNKLKNPPKSLKELVNRQDIRVIYQDPRTSSVGLGLVIWMNQIYKPNEIKEAWKTLAKHTVTVGKGWSESYGAFLKGEADAVLSYNTSPLYHSLNEKKDNYAAMSFKNGGVAQIELAAIIKNHRNQCSENFMQFLISRPAQKIIATKNVMLPAINNIGVPAYDKLKAETLKSKLYLPMVTHKQIKNWVNTWQQSLTN